ncbi:unnamed protein product [Clonostachys rosea]|uniref:FAD dependent oxidoreductase domain-containing protein n=1 Tax=Bionectria ochroleuca TaxID=29856 RepID=A0ABY6V3J1_BIOOC|nr:unnamed protein product [Clonostachys rosea]
MSDPNSFVILGAGVIGLSTALTLRSKFPTAPITILANHFPGDYNVEYCSPWAGGNWCSSANDNGLLESFDRLTFERFKEIASKHPEAGIQPSPLRMVFDQKVEDSEILSRDTGRVWYDDLVGGLIPLAQHQLPDGAVFGLDLPSTFVINTQIYLRWLLAKCQAENIRTIQAAVSSVDDAFISSSTTAVFNCTGLSSHSLGGVNDKSLYPTRGQTVLVEQPIQPLQRMYFRSPRRVDNDTTYVFQRPLAGGIILGGCREDENWNGEVDMDFAQDIMRRCCALAPELGKPEDLKVIKHGVGLRPGRKGGPRIEAEVRSKGFVVHNYGAAGAGYQASWGMANHAVSLLTEALEAKEQISPKL